MVSITRPISPEITECRPSQGIASSYLSPGFSVVFLPTLACNCSCTHCFEELNGQSIDISRLEVIFEKMLELAERVQCRSFSLYWIGGEVLCLNPDAVQKILTVADRIFRRSGISIVHRLQSNLLLYDSGKWKDVLVEGFNGRVSSSLDFPNLYRQTPEIRADEYLNTWLEKREMAGRDGLEVAVISLPNHQTLQLGAERFYRFFQEEVKIEKVQINFLFSGRSSIWRLPDLAVFSRFMTDLYRIWVESDRSLRLSPFMYLEDRLLRQSEERNCWSAFSCASNFLAMAPNGEVGQCDYLVTTARQFNYGSLIETPVDRLLDSPKRRIFLDRPFRLIENSQCGECRFWKLCHGGCPTRAYAFSGEVSAPDHYCPVFLAMFSAVLEQGATTARILRGSLGDKNVSQI